MNLFLLIKVFNFQILLKYGALTDDSSSSGGLIGTIINLIGLNSKKNKLEPDTRSLTKTVGNLIEGENSPIPAKNMIADVLYKALTSGSIQVIT